MLYPSTCKLNNNLKGCFCFSPFCFREDKFSFLPWVIIKDRENPHLNYDQTYKVRQHFLKAKILQGMWLLLNQLVYKMCLGCE